jgi:hypothetical protein
LAPARETRPVRHSTPQPSQQFGTIAAVGETAREIGEFIASIRLPARVKPDIVDAHVALTTRATRSLVWTSDPEDIASYYVGSNFIRRL